VPYKTATHIGYGVLPGEHKFAVVTLWTYRGKASQPQVVGWYTSWQKAYDIKEILDAALEKDDQHS
jgi:hypothetical protein